VFCGYTLNQFPACGRRFGLVSFVAPFAALLWCKTRQLKRLVPCLYIDVEDYDSLGLLLLLLYEKPEVIAYLAEWMLRYLKRDVVDNSVVVKDVPLDEDDEL